MTFWDFAHKHPVAAVIIFLFGAAMLHDTSVHLARIIKG